jgi:hypothetical protein
MKYMAPARDLSAGQRLRLAFDLYEVAEKMMRQNLRRRNPGASEAEIEALLLDWRRSRPGAEHGDASGPGFRPARRSL